MRTTSLTTRPRRLDHVYELFPILKERRKQQGGNLSGGEQQMLAIGRALMAEPRLLLLDEPSMGLAPLFVQTIFEILRTIRDQGVTVLLVEQNAAKALQLADRGYVLETGRIVLQDTADVLLRDDRVRMAYLGRGHRGLTAPRDPCRFLACLRRGRRMLAEGAAGECGGLVPKGGSGC